MKGIVRPALFVCLCTAAAMAATPAPQPINQGEELARLEGVTGRYGGHLVVGQKSEPKTLNPVTATDAVSREVFERLHADLIEINRSTQKTEPALAKSWKMSRRERRRAVARHLEKAVVEGVHLGLDEGEMREAFDAALEKILSAREARTVGK